MHRPIDYARMRHMIPPRLFYQDYHRPLIQDSINSSGSSFGGRMHPNYQKMWLLQQRVQERHRRRLYPRSSTVHNCTPPMAHMYQPGRVIGDGNPPPQVPPPPPTNIPRTCCLANEHSNHIDNYQRHNVLPPPPPPPPQQSNVFSHPEATEISSSCPLPLLMSHQRNDTIEVTRGMEPNIPVHQHVHHHMYHWPAQYQYQGPHISRMPHLHISISPHMQNQVSPELIPYSPIPEFVVQPTRHMSARLENYMRIVDLRRMSHISCGATQESIESHTFPHKYKRVININLIN